MNELTAVASNNLDGAVSLINRLGLDTQAVGAPLRQSFASVLQAGIDRMEDKIATANDLVRRFAIDDSVPVHQVTYALEEARLSIELTMQVRQRIIESYRELMNMQL